MTNRYIIFEQYEYWGPNGKDFTDWFWVPDAKFYKNENKAKEDLKIIKEDTKSIDKITKLKRNFEIRLIDVETIPPPKIHYGKSGRPSKAERESAEYKSKMYWINKANEDEL